MFFKVLFCLFGLRGDLYWLFYLDGCGIDCVFGFYGFWWGSGGVLLKIFFDIVRKWIVKI